MSSASAISQWGLRVPGAVGRRAGLPLRRAQLAPGPDRPRSRRRRRPGRRDRPGWGCAGGASSSCASTSATSASRTAIRSPAATDAARSAATSGPSGAAPPRIASPIRFEAVFRSALSASASPRSARRRASSSSAASTSEASSPLSSAPLRMTSGSSRSRCSPTLMHRASSPAALARAPAGGAPQAAHHEAVVQAREEPARPRAVRAAEERAGRRRRTPARRAARPPGRPGRGAPARRRRPGAARRRRPHPSPPRKARWSSTRAVASDGRASRWTRTDRALGRVGVEPGSRGREASASVRSSAAVSGVPFSSATRAAMSTPGICASRARWANAGRYAAAAAAGSVPAMRT